jgi:hypothetical protein
MTGVTTTSSGILPKALFVFLLVVTQSCGYAKAAKNEEVRFSQRIRETYTSFCPFARSLVVVVALTGLEWQRYG